jgi:diaminopimelate epimerase
LSTPFRKMHGAGNDFVLITHPDATGSPTDWPEQARALCARRTGIGADGLVISTLLGTTPATLEVACYNADGSVATMCGNALRCAAWCAHHDHGLSEMTLLMCGVKHHGQVTADGVSVTAELGEVDMRRLSVVWSGRPVWFDAAHTGTEHVVAVVPDVDDIDAETVGSLVRHHDQLAPLGTNVNFIERIGPQEIKVRTYERGVEAETLSCGSGAVAAVVIATRRGLVTDKPVTVHNRAGTPLTVWPDSGPGKSYWISGPVTHSFEGALA